MITSYHHVEIDGVRYRLAEDVEGTHYRSVGEPTRPPHSQVVQGENNLFQLRPELLVWSITDWSGGEGQIKFDPQNPNRHWRLRNVDCFSRPGKLSPAPAETSALDATGAPLTIPLQMLGTDTEGFLWAASLVDGSGGIELYRHMPGYEPRFEGTGDALNGGSDGTSLWGWAFAGDYIFFSPNRDPNDSHLYRYDTVSGGTPVLWNNDPGIADDVDRKMASVGDWVYLAASGTGQTWEIPIEGTAPVASTLVDDQPTLLGGRDCVAVVASENRAYTVWSGGLDTIVREITPSTAAGVGFADELARFGGLKAQSAWVLGGTLYVAGQLDLDLVVMYVSLVNGTYGTLGKMQPVGDGIPRFSNISYYAGGTQASFLQAFGYLGYEIGSEPIPHDLEYTTPGEYTYIVPVGVTSMRYWVTGAGGGGATAGGGGGAGTTDSFNLSPGDEITIIVGAGGAGAVPAGQAGDGEASRVRVTRDGSIVLNVTADGGTGASGNNPGQGGFSINLGQDERGGDGASAAGGIGGGGGGGAYRGLPATDASGSTGGTTGGGDGVNNGDAFNGVNGGGGGGTNTFGFGGDGGDGDVRLLFSALGPALLQEPAIYVIDQITGGMAQWATALEAKDQIAYPFFYNDGVYYTVTDEQTNPTRVVLPRHAALPNADGSLAISPSWHFGVQEDKTLHSFVLHTEPLPKDWAVLVYYQVDDDNTWTLAGTYSTRGGTGTEFVITSGQKFRSLRVRIDFDKTANPSEPSPTRPTVLGVDVFATVVKPFRSWDLMLDLGDDEQGLIPSWNGTKKINTLETAFLSGEVIEFKDGYKSRNVGSFSTHNVYIDSCYIDLERPGEGIGFVTLVEVL